jgi:molybdopterin synthase catalytic subunit
MSVSQPRDRIELTREIIPNAAIAREVRADEDGAVATFDGCVRNHSCGRSTLYLQY